MNGRLILSSACMSLPTIAILAVGCRFLVHDIPQIAEAQHRAVVLQYREQLDERWDRAVSWTELSQTNAISFVRAQPRSKMVWGYWTETHNGVPRTILWRKERGRRLGTVVETIPEFDWAHFLFVSTLGVMVFLVAVTVWAIWFFVHYANVREDFVHATAHDLTSPLLLMRNCIGRNDEMARTGVLHMTRLVQNLKDFLSLGGKCRRPEKKVFDLRKTFDLAYLTYGAAFREQEGTGRRDVPIAGPAEVPVCADETMTLQIFWNLLSNELKYAAPHGPVRAEFGIAGGRAFLRLTDEGPGLTAYERRHVFKRYYRAKSALRTGKGGFGIGLCTARAFARMMGGDLKVAPNAPRGCLFTLTLPTC